MEIEIKSPSVLMGRIFIDFQEVAGQKITPDFMKKTPQIFKSVEYVLDKLCIELGKQFKKKRIVVDMTMDVIAQGEKNEKTD